MPFKVGGKLITRVVFGETITDSELENAGIAVVKKDYRAQKDNQMTLKKVGVCCCLGPVVDSWVYAVFSIVP